MTVVAQIKKQCSVCGEALDKPLLAFPGLPFTGLYAKVPKKGFLGGANQEFCLCNHCGHGQLRNVIDGRYLYGTSYGFRTSQSETAKGGTDTFLSFLAPFLGKRRLKSVVDIGCNDLYLLKSLSKRSKSLFGIDPIWSGRAVSRCGNITLVGKFIEDVRLSDIVKSAPDLVCCQHTLEHIAKPKEVLQSLLSDASSETLFAFEVPSLDCLLEGFRFDRIFHQHVQYFSLRTFKLLLNNIGAEYLGSRFNRGHWGSLTVIFRKSRRRRIESRPNPAAIRALRADVQNRYRIFKKQMSAAGRRITTPDAGIYGYGATLMLPVVYYHLGIRPQDLKVIFDDDRTKDGWSFANLNVRIQFPRTPALIRDARIVITALDHVRPILRKILQYQPRQIIMPLNLI